MYRSSKVVALDCEMVEGTLDNCMLARVVVTDGYGTCQFMLWLVHFFVGYGFSTYLDLTFFSVVAVFVIVVIMVSIVIIVIVIVIIVVVIIVVVIVIVIVVVVVGNIIFHAFVRPQCKVMDYKTELTGISAHDLYGATGRVIGCTKSVHISGFYNYVNNGSYQHSTLSKCKNE